VIVDERFGSFGDIRCRANEGLVLDQGVSRCRRLACAPSPL